MNKFLLDSNLFFLDPDCIEAFGNNEVYVCMTVLEELDNHKTDSGLNGYNVRKSIKKLENNPNVIFIEDGKDTLCLYGFDLSVPDNRILLTAKQNDLIVVTNDVSMRVKAKMKGIIAEHYNNVEQKEIGNLRKGKHFIKDSGLLARLYNGEKIPKLEEMSENDFVIFTESDKKVSAIVRNGMIKLCNLTKQHPKDIQYRNYEQQLLATHIYENKLEMITVAGSFGVGKTFLAVQVALDLIEKGIYNKLFICKSPVVLDKDFALGFRPNGFLEKVMPTLASFTSNIAKPKTPKNNKNSSEKVVSGVDVLLGLIDFGIIEIVDLEYIQGVTLPEKSIVIFDEFQLMNKETGRAVLSRASNDSLILCLGDLKQLPSHKHNVESSALYHAINCFEGYNKYAHITLEEVVRSKFVSVLDKVW